MAQIKAYEGKLSISRCCMLLGINRSRIYYQHRERACDSELMNQIHEIWLDCPFYGYRRIKVILLERDYVVNHKRVRRLMAEMNLEAIYPRPKTTIRDKSHAVYPYLLRGMKITRINQVWGVDITYIKMASGFVYLVALIDVYSRYIVGWNVSVSLDTENCLMALDYALARFGAPDIINSDQGCQFTSGDWVSRVNESGAKISMDGKGRCLDNVYIERFWRTLKQENIYLNVYDTVLEAKNGINEFIAFYNYCRPHQALDYKKPSEIYFEGACC